MKIFTFCLYGNEKKYCSGLLGNLELIHEFYPDFYVCVAVGHDVSEQYKEKICAFSNVRVVEHPITGPILKLYRYFFADMDGVELCFVRDADSRIGARDRWCIDRFIASDKKFHIIRDHFWHKTRIPGGTWGCKKGFIRERIRSLYDGFIADHEELTDDLDQVFLEERIYPRVKNDVLLHTNINRYQDESATAIDYPNDNTNFVGNVLIFDTNGDLKPEFTYWDFDLTAQLSWLRGEQAWDIIMRIESEIDLSGIGPEQLSQVLDEFYIACYYSGKYDDCQRILAAYEFTHINEHIIENSNHLFAKLGKKVIGTTDPEREAAGDEMVVVYGNYHWSHHCLPHSNKLYRHAKYYSDIYHHEFEFDKAWNQVDNIYILNLEQRKDRLMEILVELCRMNAPLDRIYRYVAKQEAITGDQQQDTYIGAQKNHLDVVNHFIGSKKSHCIIFEDDFSFTSSVEQHKSDLEEFFSRKYEYDVCLLSASQYGKIVNHDDLLNKSYQACTTTSGYIINALSAIKIRDIFQEGYKKLLEGCDPDIYCCDRYWSVLQKQDRFFLFKNKLGYQRASYSNITGQTDCHFD